MPSTFTYTFDTPLYKGKSTFNTGLFINGEFVDPVDDAKIELVWTYRCLSINANLTPGRVVNPCTNLPSLFL